MTSPSAHDETAPDPLTQAIAAIQRQQFASTQPRSSQHTAPAQHWLLLGTSGCHLCDIANTMLTQLQTVTGVSYQPLDISELPEADMLALAMHIPIVVSAERYLCYPFSLLELQQLLVQ